MDPKDEEPILTEEDRQQMIEDLYEPSTLWILVKERERQRRARRAITREARRNRK